MGEYGGSKRQHYRAVQGARGTVGAYIKQAL